ncbi:hypothetical protein Q3G72_008659 [Acer saccharum]|jgi:hypothetical protein|nr:hypothetical protein Q3G72_008659 [Acer saccharum]
MKTYTIYKITNTPTGKAYIGASTNPHSRLYSHKNANPHFLEGGFKLDLLKEGLTRRQADRAERVAILQHKTLAPDGFNKRGGGFKGYKHELETIEKMSANYNRDRKAKTPNSAEARARQAQTLREKYAKEPHPSKGRVVSDQARAKQSAAMKGRPSKQKGAKRSDEIKERMKAAWAEKRANGIKRASRGPVSPEQKAKQKASLAATLARKKAASACAVH